MNRGRKPQEEGIETNTNNETGGSMIKEAAKSVKDTATALKDTQVEALDLTKQVLIGATAKDGITGILNTILPIPPEQLAMLKAYPEFNNFLMVVLGTVINETVVHSEKGEKILVAATSSAQVDMAMKYKLHTLGAKFKEMIEDLADGNIFSGLFGDDVEEAPKEVENKSETDK